MHKIYDLKDMLCEELEEYGAKDKLDVGSLDVVDKLAHAIKNINKIIEHYEDEEGYSEDGGMMMDGRKGNRTYSIRGSYARGRRGNVKRDRMGRYSSESGYSRAEADMDSMVSELRDMMHDLPEEKKHEVQKFIDRIERM